MDLLRTAVRQAFMPKREYERLREEDKAWNKLRRPICITIFCITSLAVVASVIISLTVVFPRDRDYRPFCEGVRRNFNYDDLSDGDDHDMYLAGMYITDRITVDYYFDVLFIPTMIVFLASVLCLLAGVTVAYSGPRRHRILLRLVQSVYCASRRGRIRHLVVLNLFFAALFASMATFLGPALLEPWSSCSLPLLLCYETALWGLVILFGATSFLLKARSPALTDEDQGLEMSTMMTDIERCVHEGLDSVNEIVSLMLVDDGNRLGL